MDKIKRITYDELSEVVAIAGFDFDLMLKDFYATAILYLLKDVSGLYFKGGTALQKTFLDYARLSEDVDFTVTAETGKLKPLIKEIIENSELFDGITTDKDVEGFTRIVIHYKSFADTRDFVYMDLNKRAKLICKPVVSKIKHFYTQIPAFSFSMLARDELIAEKVAATIGRNKPRDHYDVYRIIRAKLPIDLKLVKKKCEQSGYEFDIIRMFNRAKKLKRRWDENLLPMLVEKVSFEEVMKTLAEAFNLKGEKEKKKEKNG